MTQKECALFYFCRFPSPKCRRPFCVFSCLTSRPQTTRGTGADVILVDEAAHIDPDQFYKVMYPILSMSPTSLMCLSSPEGDDNYFSGLMNLKRKDGTDFFVTLNCFRICKRCQKLDRVKAIQCSHVPNTPHWLSGRKIKDLKLLFTTRPEDAMRE